MENNTNCEILYTNLLNVDWLINSNIPVQLSFKILEVMMRPYGLKMASKSGCEMFLGNPETYKLAPLMDSDDGRAKET